MSEKFKIISQDFYSIGAKGKGERENEVRKNRNKFIRERSI